MGFIKYLPQINHPKEDK